MSRMIRNTLLTVTLLLNVMLNCHANDTSAAMGAGGIAFEKSASVQMRSEKLYISEKEIRVDYQFKNTSDSDVTTTIAFPFPLVPNSDYIPMPELTGPFPDNYVSFKVTVDNHPVETQVTYKAIHDDTHQDVTELIQKIGLPLDPNKYWGNAFLELSPETLKFLQENKLLDNDGDYLFQPTWSFNKDTGLAETYDARSDVSALLKKHGLPLDTVELKDDQLEALSLEVKKELLAAKAIERPMIPNWSFQTVRFWPQTFPKNSIVHVQHRYTPILGTTAGSPFNMVCQQENAAEKPYCIDKNLIAALDPRHRFNCKAYTGGENPRHEVGFLDYILTTGANWQGPIQDFTLTIDKGSPKNFVSLCFSGLKKISPTQFQYKAKNFTPKADLHILLFKHVTSLPDSERH